MNQFSVKEIESMLKFHQDRADRYHNLFNGSIYRIALVIVDNPDTNIKFCNIDQKDELAIMKIREAIYEMSVFHTTERVRWQMILEQTKTDNL